MTDTLGFNEGKDFLLNGALRAGVSISTAYFLISNKAVIVANLTVAATLPTGTITVDDTSAFPASGTFVVGSQTVTYTGKTGTTFTGCTGGTGTFPIGQLAIGSTGFQPSDTLAGGASEITAWTGGTPYARKSQVVPAPSTGIITFAALVWGVGTATDGPAAAKSVVMASTVNNTGVAFFAWNIVAGGGGQNFVQNTNFQFTPVFFLRNVGGS